jgi:predicted DCC family thiol-disulfide oxidoreductase YuxK
MSRPVLFFDGDCGFCTRSAELLRRLRVDADIEPWQFSDIGRYGITPDEATEAVQFVDAAGRVSSGHRAIAGVLRTGGALLRLVGVILVLPGVSQVAGLVYRLVARYRYRLPGGTPACAPRLNNPNLNGD